GPRNPSRSKKRLLKTALRDNYLEKRRPLVLNRLSTIMVITTDKHNERLAVMLAKVSRIKTVINLWQT
ncbi:hypothetical protein ACK3Z9_20255, partial [Aeromonas caviae]